MSAFDALSVAVAIAAWFTLFSVFAGIGWLIAYWRWQRFLKLLDDRLGDRADGSRLTAPDDLKLFHSGKESAR